MRASGVRVKPPTTAPSLVAMTTTQVPIVGRSRETKRFLTMREAARLQSMHKLRHLPENESLAVQALGNAVNVEVVRRIALALFGRKPLQSNEAALEAFAREGVEQIAMEMSAA